LSLLATWGQTRKKVESWWLWIAADVIYVPLYAYKDLWLTAILYLGFIALCVLGLRSWSRDLRREAVIA
ncbi:MAG: nicotinamide mononucleotide transporter family protein, partial [Umezawaea sp.]